MRAVFLAGLSLAFTACVTPVAKHRGEGAAAVLDASPEEVRAALHRLWDGGGPGWSVIDRESSAQRLYHLHGVTIRYTAYWEPGARPGQLRVEMVCEGPAVAGDVYDRGQGQLLIRLEEDIRKAR
ncbi:MAG: hypothetical protein HY077_13105 [Elusimicrobia bacterium]|nr:hypothetical protein [Elusimicrobiota bacterium]